MKQRIKPGQVASRLCCNRLGLSVLQTGGRFTHRNQQASGQVGVSSSPPKASLPRRDNSGSKSQGGLPETLQDV